MINPRSKVKTRNPTYGFGLHELSLCELRISSLRISSFTSPLPPTLYYSRGGLGSIGISKLWNQQRRWAELSWAGWVCQILCHMHFIFLPFSFKSPEVIEFVDKSVRWAFKIGGQKSFWGINNFVSDMKGKIKWRCVPCFFETSIYTPYRHRLSLV